MTMVLDHMIVPAHDKEAAALFFARIFGLSYEGPQGHFGAVRINADLTLDFDTKESFESHHYAFKVSENDFDDIFERLKQEGIPHGSGPFSHDDMKINHRRGGRGVYFKDADGHLWEALTV